MNVHPFSDASWSRPLLTPSMNDCISGAWLLGKTLDTTTFLGCVTRSWAVEISSSYLGINVWRSSRSSVQSLDPTHMVTFSKWLSIICNSLVSLSMRPLVIELSLVFISLVSSMSLMVLSPITIGTSYWWFFPQVFLLWSETRPSICFLSERFSCVKRSLSTMSLSHSLVFWSQYLLAFCKLLLGLVIVLRMTFKVSFISWWTSFILRMSAA